MFKQSFASTTLVSVEPTDVSGIWILYLCGTIMGFGTEIENLDLVKSNFQIKFEPIF